MLVTRCKCVTGHKDRGMFLLEDFQWAPTIWNALWGFHLLCYIDCVRERMWNSLLVCNVSQRSSDSPLSAVCHILNKKRELCQNGWMCWVSAPPPPAPTQNTELLVTDDFSSPFLLVILCSSLWLVLPSLLPTRLSKLSQTYHPHMSTIYGALLRCSILAADVTAVNTIRNHKKGFSSVLSQLEVFPANKSKSNLQLTLIYCSVSRVIDYSLIYTMF